jgi:hypothetical protein
VFEADPKEPPLLPVSKTGLRERVDKDLKQLKKIKEEPGFKRIFWWVKGSGARTCQIDK